ncbi:helix-turn-helix domain-containing protein [Primorskyibacter flagellatus]|uniref:helix-turn-helix domain-containing protein n=1 Tax=Primorskyibacter flagellatus TaxID=1387277 RepID=UPI00117B25EB|nr:helix-turn-helix domain-containing protein [Primorskyibacter flagellatus]
MLTQHDVPGGDAPMKKLKAQQRDQIFRLLRQGVSQADIARDFGVHRSTVSRMERRRVALSEEGRTTAMVGVRVSDTEATAIDEAVQRLKFRNRSEFLRAVIRAALSFPEFDGEVSTELSAVKASFDRAGGNLNQVARDMSASMKKLGRAEPSARELAQIYALHDEVIELRRALVALLGRSQKRSDVLARMIAEGSDAL